MSIPQTDFQKAIAAGGEVADLALYQLAGTVSKKYAPPGLSDDVQQGCWLHLRQILPRVDVAGNPFSFCYGAASREAWRLLRHEAKHTARGEAGDDDEHRLPERVASTSEAIDILMSREAVEPLLRSRRFRALVRELGAGDIFSEQGRLIANRVGRRLGQGKRGTRRLLDAARAAVVTRRPPGKSLPPRPVRCVESGQLFASYRQCWRTLKIDRRHLSKVLAGERQTVAGLRFRWADTMPARLHPLDADCRPQSNRRPAA